jgi:hypothetical protein
MKSSYRTDTAENESHETTDETTVSPAGSLEGGPEVATQTTLARLAVVQEKPVSAAHPIVVEVVNDRNFEIKSSLIYGWGEAREDIVNHPKIKTAFFLQMHKLYCDSTAVKCTNRKHELAAERPTEKFLSRALIICYIMRRECGIPKRIYKTFLPSKFQITTEDLENPQTLHWSYGTGKQSKKKEEARKAGFWLFDI